MRFLLLLLSLISIQAQFVPIGFFNKTAGTNEGGGGITTVTNGMIAYWPLDEVSGSRSDSISTNTLSDNNTVTSDTPGLVTGRKAIFAAANSEFLSRTDSTSPRLDFSGDVSMTIGCVVRLTATNAISRIITKYATGSNQRSYILHYVNTSARAGFQVSSDGSTVTTASSNVLNPTTSDVLYILAGRDADTDEIWISVNNETRVTISQAGFFNSNAQFRLGADNTASAVFSNIELDEVYVWNRSLSQAEIAFVYNRWTSNQTLYP